MICWEVISRSHLHESPIPMGYYGGGGVVITLLDGNLPRRSQWPGRKNPSSEQPCVLDQGEPYNNRGFQPWSIYTALRGIGSARLNSDSP